MNISQTLAALGLAALLSGLAAPAVAGDGHDHGDEAPAAVGTALPRFVALSETFELVGVLDGRQLTLYLDRFADNAPVREAQIELEFAGAKLAVQARGDDVYEAMLADAPKPGVLPVTATVTAGTDIDLLAGELDLHEAAHAEAEAEAEAHEHAWTASAGWIAGGGAALVLAALTGAWFGARRPRAAPPTRTGGLA